MKTICCQLKRCFPSQGLRFGERQLAANQLRQLAVCKLLLERRTTVSLFFIVHESTEDTLDSTSNLPDALRLAKEIARQGQSGDPVTVLDSEGKAARQFALLPDGSVAEQTIALQVRIAAAAAENHRTEQVASSDF